MSEVVRDIIILPARRVLGSEIAAEIAALYDLTMADLCSPSRKRRIAYPRQHAMWEVRLRAPHLSLERIGKLLGGRNHATILHGVRAHERRLMEARGRAA